MRPSQRALSNRAFEKDLPLASRYIASPFRIGHAIERPSASAECRRLASHGNPQLTASPMKTFIAFIVLAFSSLASTAAPASDESIKTLFRVMKAESMLDSVYAVIEPAMRQGIAQAVDGKTLSEEHK